MRNKIASSVVATMAAMLIMLTLSAADGAEGMPFPEGTATPSETCGGCHKAIYREFAFGFGSDIHYKPTTLPTKEGDKMTMPATVSGTPTAHAFAGMEPYPIHAR